MLSVKNNFGAVSWAAIQGNADMLCTLLAHGAKVDIGLQVR